MIILRKEIWLHILQFEMGHSKVLLETIRNEDF